MSFRDENTAMGQRAIKLGNIGEELFKTVVGRQGWATGYNHRTKNIGALPGFDFWVKSGPYEGKVEVKSCSGWDDKNKRPFETGFLQCWKGTINKKSRPQIMQGDAPKHFFVDLLGQIDEDWFNENYTPRHLAFINHHKRQMHFYDAKKLRDWVINVYLRHGRPMAIEDNHNTLGIKMPWVIEEAGYMETFNLDEETYNNICKRVQ